MNDRPQTLLDALCEASGVQGGTIHQYNLGRIKWQCSTPPNSRRNTEGIYSLIYTDPDGADWSLGWIGGPSIAATRKYSPIHAGMQIRFEVEPVNRKAYDKSNERHVVAH